VLAPDVPGDSGEGGGSSAMGIDSLSDALRRPVLTWPRFGRVSLWREKLDTPRHRVKSLFQL